MAQPLIEIFNGRKRALGEPERRDVYLKLSVGMRKHLKHFKGARLAVFMAIALHADELGWAWPTVSLMSQETGCEDVTIYKALNALCRLEINRSRVLLRTKHAPDHYVPETGGGYARNFYLIFPSAEECKSLEEREDATCGDKGSDLYKENRTPKNLVRKTVPQKINSVFSGTKKNHSGSKPDPRSEQEPHTPQQPPLIAAPQALVVRPGVGVLSKFSLEQNIRFAEHNAAQPDSVIRDAQAVGRARYRDGQDDPLIEQWLSRTPEQIADERAAPREEKFTFAYALQMVGTGAQRNPGGAMAVIGELFERGQIDDDVRGRLVGRFTQAAAGGSQ